MYAEGYPVLVRSAGGGATVADSEIFGFYLVRPAEEDGLRSIGERYHEVADLVLVTLGALRGRAEVAKCVGSSVSGITVSGPAVTRAA